MNVLFIFFINYYQVENFAVRNSFPSIAFTCIFTSSSEQYSLSHDLRFQYINHADSIRVAKIDDIKDMRDTQVILAKEFSSQLKCCFGCL